MFISPKIKEVIFMEEDGYTLLSSFQAGNLNIEVMTIEKTQMISTFTLESTKPLESCSKLQQYAHLQNSN